MRLERKRAKSSYYQDLQLWHSSWLGETDKRNQLFAERCNNGEFIMDKPILKKRWTPRRLLLMGAAVLFAAFVVYTVVLGDARNSLNVARERLAVSTVERGVFQEFIPITGIVLPQRTIYLDAVEGGRVAKIFAEAGATLREGDPIVLLQNATMVLDAVNREAQMLDQMNNLQNSRVAMEQTRLALKNQIIDLENQIANAKRIYEQNKALIEKRLVAQEEFERARDNYDFLKKRLAVTIETVHNDSMARMAQVRQLERSTERLHVNFGVVKQNLDNMLVRAPVAGQLTSLNCEIGEAKTPGQRLGQIDIIDAFKARAPIDEFYLARVNLGQSGECEVNGVKYRLVVRKVYSEVKNGKFEVDMYFEGKIPEGVKRGQSLQIRLELGGEERAVLLPRGGFYQKTAGQWVYVLGANDQEAVKRPIRLGRQNPNVFEVLEGLQSGDRVITSSYDAFGDAEKLILK
jgi:HlyD family secretion protein